LLVDVYERELCIDAFVLSWGLNQIAYDLFYCCLKIGYIIGPRQSIGSEDMLIAFNLLLYNVAYRAIDPVVATEKIKNGTDIRFVCFDQLEVQGDYGFWAHIKNYDEKMRDESIAAKERSNEIVSERDYARIS
jgi:hypothetical protein